MCPTSGGTTKRKRLLVTDAPGEEDVQVACTTPPAVTYRSAR